MKLNTALVIGGGAGVLSHALGATFPNTIVHTVENDEVVLQVAHHYFGFTKSRRQRIFLDDGRHFLSALVQPETYDLIVMDAFVNADDGEGVFPVGMTTCQFFSLVQRALSSGGLFLINSIDSSRTNEWLRTLDHTFTKGVWSKKVGTSQSIIIAPKGRFQIPEDGEGMELVQVKAGPILSDADSACP